MLLESLLTILFSEQERYNMSLLFFSRPQHFASGGGSEPSTFVGNNILEIEIERSIDEISIEDSYDEIEVEEC